MNCLLDLICVSSVRHEIAARLVIVKCSFLEYKLCDGMCHELSSEKLAKTVILILLFKP